MATLEGSELVKLLDQAESLRDKAMLTLLVDNGMRAGEICSLLNNNIKHETVLVCGKVGWREVPISEETRRLLLQLASQSKDQYVFHDDHKKPISRFTIYRIVREHMEKVGIKGPKLGPHRIRHAFGKGYLVMGGDTRSLQRILGHKKISTTEKYADLADREIIDKHHRFTPLRAVHGAAQGILIDRVVKEAEEILLKNEKGGEGDN
jgi:integrase/recombinase XerD